MHNNEQIEQDSKVVKPHLGLLLPLNRKRKK